MKVCMTILSRHTCSQSSMHIRQSACWQLLLLSSKMTIGPGLERACHGREFKFVVTLMTNIGLILDALLGSMNALFHHCKSAFEVQYLLRKKPAFQCGIECRDFECSLSRDVAPLSWKANGHDTFIEILGLSDHWSSHFTGNWNPIGSIKRLVVSLTLKALIESCERRM